MQEMKFSEAIEKMKVGDKFKFDGEILTMVEHETGDFNTFKSDLHDEYVLVEPDLMVKFGKIIPAEPVVLSANEYMQSLLSIDRDIILTIEDDAEYHIKKAFIVGGKNGQRRDRQRTQPLIDAVDVFLKRINVDCEDQTELSLHRVKLRLILKDIKPLS